MIRLIKKDINVMARYLLISITFPILAFMIASLDRTSAYFAFILHIMYFSYSTIDGSIRDDKKANSNILFSSLPINKNDTIKSKYIVYGFVPLLYSLIFYISVLGVRENSNSIQSYFFTDAKLGFDLVALSIAISLITFSLLIPMAYKEGKARIISWIIASSIYVFGLRFVFGGSLVPDTIFNPLTLIVLVIIALVAYLISMRFVMNLSEVGE